MQRDRCDELLKLFGRDGLVWRIGSLREGGWDRAKLLARLQELLTFPGEELVRGADGIDEGLPEALRNATLSKFRPGGLLVVHCGGSAGLFSAIIGGWAGGATGSQPVIAEIEPWA